MMDAEKRAVNAEFFGSYRKINPLEQGVGRRPGAGTLAGPPVSEGKKSNAFHTCPNRPATACIPCRHDGCVDVPEETASIFKTIELFILAAA
ncbi:hypothetical protein ACFVVC_21715 [Pseudarthrobacter sp. NPDC058196]|uniref:hypothetical protein n=1 Tax=Pseudarthrobacter sp. NPDC058196 TaxID=3346376 RepID=UPI0036DC92A4